MKNLYYICAQPAIPYYHWQLEVMIHNFRKNGIKSEQIHILLGAGNDYYEEYWNKFKEKYSNVVIEVYQDNRVTPMYVPSLRPHILKHHFKKYQYLQKNAVFYHDCDMLFTQPVNWQKFIDDDTWYVSNTISYIGAEYIKSKKLNIFQEMCDIIGVDAKFVEQQEANSGGAQYIMKNVTPEFWEKVERDSEELTKYFNRKVSEYHNILHYHPIQAWTADMWAVLWNGWKFNHDIKVVPEMDFCWATDRISNWDRLKIFHNAGVTPNDKKLFFKGHYIAEYPRVLDTNKYDREYCSYRYIQEIKEVLN